MRRPGLERLRLTLVLVPGLPGFMRVIQDFLSDIYSPYLSVHVLDVAAGTREDARGRCEGPGMPEFARLTAPACKRARLFLV